MIGLLLEGRVIEGRDQNDLSLRLEAFLYGLMVTLQGREASLEGAAALLQALVGFYSGEKMSDDLEIRDKRKQAHC